MRLLAIGIEHPLDVTVQRPHDSNPRHHRVAAAATQHQRFNCRLPFRQVGFLLRQLGDVVCRVVQREQLPAVGQNDGILKRGRPGHAKCFLFKMGRGRRTGSAATPSRAVLRRGLIAICATGSHAKCPVASRNETRRLSLMSTPLVNSGTENEEMRQANSTASLYRLG
jgi:hypothetical protein